MLDNVLVEKAKFVGAPSNEVELPERHLAHSENPEAEGVGEVVREYQRVGHRYGGRGSEQRGHKEGCGRVPPS